MLNRVDALERTVEFIALQGVVTQVIVRALVAEHPDPGRLRKVVESLLLQAHGTLALSVEGSLQFQEQALPILDALFQPAIVLPPDDGE
jgi:hypothetical protein